MAEAAAYLKKTPETVRRWCREGKIPTLGKLLGSEWRLDPAAVRALLGTPSPAAQRREREEAVRAKLDAAYRQARARRTGS